MSSKFIKQKAQSPKRGPSKAEAASLKQNKEPIASKGAFIAGHIIDTISGLPISHVPLQLIFVDKAGETKEALSHSDEYGFVSWKIKNIQEEEVSTFHIKASDGTKLPVVPTPEGEPENISNFLMRLNSQKLGINQAGKKTYVSENYSPSLAQLTASPKSFVRVPQIKFGEGECQIPVPGAVAPVEFSFAQLVRRTTPPTGVVSIAPPPVINPSAVDILASPAAVDTQLFYGQRMIYKQKWRLIGQSLGDIHYSLPLAPLESVNIAVID